MPFTIDVHHHILPDFFWREMNEQHGPVGGVAPAPWSREETLAFMDDAEIDVAVTSISTPGVHMGDARARSLARRCNELSAETFRRLYWDTALSWRDPVLEMRRSIVGIDRVLYGSDFPYLRRDLAIAGRQQLAHTEALRDAERKKMFGETASNLLPRFAPKSTLR